MKKIEKAVQSGIQKIKDQNLFIGEIKINMNCTLQRAAGQFSRAVVLKDRRANREIYFSASIRLDWKEGREESTVVHEYGHYVDWILGGAYTGVESVNPSFYWSNQNFPSSFDRKNQRELFAEAFTHYCYKGSLQGFFIPSLKEEQGEFKNQLEIKFKTLQSF